MPTARGWIVGGLGGGLAVTGRVFGSEPLVQLGYALIVLVLIAVIVVRLGRHELRVERRVSPERAAPGESVTAHIQVENAGRGSAPLLLLEDALPDGVSGTPRFAIQGIEPGGTRETGYSIVPGRRGRYDIGPLTIAVVDPFGLARLRSAWDATCSVLVHPRIESLSLPKEKGHRRSTSTSASRNPAGMRGEEFYTLREYVEGDDLRRTHWPATAKRGRYMIRQEESPWHTRATVVLDDRATAHDGAGTSSSFERAVEAAASLVDLYHRSGYTYRVVAAVDQGTPLARGPQHRSRCLDYLALARPHAERGGEDGLAKRLLELDSSAAQEAALLVVTGTLTQEAAVSLAHAARRFRQAHAISFPGHRFGTQNTKARWNGETQVVETLTILTRAGVGCLALGPDEPLAAAWSTFSQKGEPPKEGPWGLKPELV